METIKNENGNSFPNIAVNSEAVSFQAPHPSFYVKPGDKTRITLSITERETRNAELWNQKPCLKPSVQSHFNY